MRLNEVQLNIVVTLKAASLDTRPPARFLPFNYPLDIPGAPCYPRLRPSCWGSAGSSPSNDFTHPDVEDALGNDPADRACVSVGRLRREVHLPRSSR